MTLPLDDVLYYFHHIAGDKYVHPRGGSDYPGDNTELVFHQPVGRLALQFLFKTIKASDGNDYRQLMHYGSGKYVHPKSGSTRVGDDVRVVLYTGTDGLRTSVTMKADEGMTFLVSADNRGGRTFYVHPLWSIEGQFIPKDDTSLVYYEGFRRDLAIAIVPAEEFSVVSLEFDQKAIDNLESSKIAVQKTITNNTNNSSTSVVTLTYSRSVTNTVTLSFTEKLGVKVTNKAKSDFFVAGAEVTVEVSFEFSSTQTTSTSTTEGVQISSTETITVSPMSAVKVSLITTRASGKVPFKALVRSPRGKELTIQGSADMELFLDQKVIQDPVS